MARPTKLTKEGREKICSAIKAGSYPAVAAESAGIGASTFYNWMKEGRESEKGQHRDFYDAVKRASAEGEVRATALITKAMTKDWRAAMAILERRHPERWARRERPDPAIEEERPVIDLTKLSDREIKTLERINARAAKPD